MSKQHQIRTSTTSHSKNQPAIAAKGKGPLPPDLAQKASAALAQLEGAHSQVLQKLRQLAALEGVEASMTKVQLLTAAHIKLIRARNAIYQQLAIIIF